jgi:hypothetical protein
MYHVALQPKSALLGGIYVRLYVGQYVEILSVAVEETAQNLGKTCARPVFCVALRIRSDNPLF